jgi:hypothetical protein
MKVKYIRNEGQPWVGFVKKKFFWSSGKIKRNGPAYGDIVTVAREFWEDGHKWYNLLEWPNGTGYGVTWFIPLEHSEEKFEEVTFEKIKEKAPASAN